MRGRGEEDEEEDDEDDVGVKERSAKDTSSVTEENFITAFGFGRGNVLGGGKVRRVAEER